MTITQIACIIAILILVVVCIINHTNSLNELLLEGILEAEKLYNTTTGQERLKIAIDYVYEILPTYIKVILPKSFLLTILKESIQNTFDKVKALLDFQK